MKRREVDNLIHDIIHMLSKLRIDMNYLEERCTKYLQDIDNRNNNEEQQEVENGV